LALCFIETIVFVGTNTAVIVMASLQPILTTTRVFFAIMELSMMLAMLYFAAEGVLNENGFQLLGKKVQQNTTTFLFINFLFFTKIFYVF